MLIITRKPGESFYVGNNVHITVEEVSGDKVKISINAPKDISILRKELHDAQILNREASQLGALNVNAFKDRIKKTNEH